MASARGEPGSLIVDIGKSDGAQALYLHALDGGPCTSFGHARRSRGHDAPLPRQHARGRNRPKDTDKGKGKSKDKGAETLAGALQSFLDWMETHPEARVGILLLHLDNARTNNRTDAVTTLVASGALARIDRLCILHADQTPRIAAETTRAAAALRATPAGVPLPLRGGRMAPAHPR